MAEPAPSAALPPVDTAPHAPVEVPPETPAAPQASTGPAWLVTLRSRYDRLRQGRVFGHPATAWVGLLAGVAAFTVVVGWIWSTRYWAFDTAAWDLGAYHQAMYTTLVDHRLFYYTNDLPAGTNGNLFASHFSPFLFVLLPFYALSPNPSGLLVIQAAGLALGAIPIYYLARRRLGAGLWPALFAGLYLLSPLTIGTGWYDFHPEAFLPVTGLTAIYFYEERRVGPFLLAWVLSLAVIETMAPFLLVLAGVALAATVVRRRSIGPDRFRSDLWLNGAAAAIALAWLGLSAAVTYSLGPAGGTFGSGYGGSWSILGAPSILSVYPRAITAPGAAAAALAHDAGLKLLYIVLIYGSLAFLPFFGKLRYQLPALGWIGLAILSNHTGYYVVNDQYPGYVLPFLYPAAITGIEWWRKADLRPRRTGLRAPVIAGALVTALVVTSAVCSPLLAAPYGSFNAVPHGVPVLIPHDSLLHRVIGLIPPAASVLTSSFLFPEVSNRPNAYVMPISSLFVGNLTFQSVVNRYVNDSQYLLLDFQVDFPGAALMTATVNVTGFGLEAAAEGAELYARGWSGAPSIWVPFTSTSSGGGVDPGLATVDDSVVSSVGASLVHSAGSGTGVFWRGPVVERIPPGTYRVSAELHVDATTPGPQIGFEVLNQTIGITTTVSQVGDLGRSYALSYGAVPGPPLIISNRSNAWNGSAPSSYDLNFSVTVTWEGPGFLQAEGWVLSPSVTARLWSVSFVQLAPG